MSVLADHAESTLPENAIGEIMYITCVDRKKLQIFLEAALQYDIIDDIQFDKKTQKSFYAMMLHFIYELNERDVEMIDSKYKNLCNTLHEVVRDFSYVKIPDFFDFDYIKKFANLTNKITEISVKLNDILLLLNKEYNERIGQETPRVTVKQ